MKKIITDSIIIVVSVTLAFLAENLREYLNERSYEKEIIKDIKDDIVGDSIQFSGFANDIKRELPILDSVINALDKAKFRPGDTLDFIYLTPRYVLFPRTGGYSDLKSNYGTNLIQTKKLRRAISGYYELRDYTLLNWTKMHQENQTFIDQFLREKYDQLEDSYGLIRSTSKKSDFKNICLTRRNDLAGQLVEFQTQLKKARQVIKEIDRE
ncbi:MAG TPA: hypothetical protein PLR06_04265 [Cyclobacteriaceae bacterium]|nr:hypothetical protein [Cyclobacteriaceae bacterium]